MEALLKFGQEHNPGQWCAEISEERSTSILVFANEIQPVHLNVTWSGYGPDYVKQDGF